MSVPQHSSPSDPVMSLAPYAKAIGGLLGGLTPAVVIGLLAAFHVSVDPTLASAICTVAAALGAYLAPANKPKPVAPPVTPVTPVAPVAPPQ